MYKKICALCDETSVIYVLYGFKDHVFRVYPNGHITTAGKNDLDAVADFIRG